MIDHQQRHHCGRPHRGPTVLLAVALAALTCILALAACGSSTKPTATTASDLTSRLAFAKCVRSHGVPNFPDGPNIPVGVAQSPAFRSAARTCGRLLPGGGGRRGGVSESTRLSLLKHAQCMRAHGVSNYPDPTIPSRGPFMSGPPAGINTDSPAFRRAATACGGQ